jgi:DNA-3-methyladenine glycosylase II
MTDVGKPMTRSHLQLAIDTLRSRDTLLRQLADQFGMPPLWRRQQSFETLVHVVLEQKVSLSSAEAVMSRVKCLCPEMGPAAFLRVPELQLRNCGISERKVSYCQSIALAMVNDQLSLARLRRCTDEQVMEQLTAIRGIGPWTAGVYLLMAMRRPDAWASGDRALAVSLAESEGLPAVPTYAELDIRAESWRPHRSAAARLLWHAYLSRRGQG